MKQKKHTYFEDIKDTFTEKGALKDAKKIAEDIKILQSSFFADTKYKEKLLKRLNTTHIIRQDTMSTPSNFSIFHMFSAIFSLFFISIVVFMIHDARTQEMWDIIPKQIESTMNSLHIEEVQEDLSQKEIDIVEDPSNMWGSLINIEASEESVNQQQEAPMRVGEINSDNAAFKKQSLEKQQEFTIKKYMPEEEKSSDTSSEQGETSQRVEEVIPQTDTDTWNAENQNEENIEMNISDFMDVVEDEDDFSQDTFWDETMPASGMMMDMEFDSTESVPFVSEFQKLCEDEYDGEFLFSSNLCRLPNEKTCSEADISTCALEEKSEEVLEEPNDNFGQ